MVCTSVLSVVPQEISFGKCNIGESDRGEIAGVLGSEGWKEGEGRGIMGGRKEGWGLRLVVRACRNPLWIWFG